MTEGAAELAKLEPVVTVPRHVILESLESHRPVLLAAARSIVRHEAEAQDLVQTTLELGLRRMDQLRDPGAIRAWLLAIEVREAFRLTRLLRRFVAFESHVTELAVAGPSASDAALRVALGHLPARTRAAIVLHPLAGLTVEETATAMGTSPNTAKTQLRDGLARLRRELDDD